MLVYNFIIINDASSRAVLSKNVLHFVSLQLPVGAITVINNIPLPSLYVKWEKDIYIIF